MVERDPVTGHLRLLGELDFVAVPAMRAELALRMDAPGPHTVDLSALKLLAPGGAELLDELLEHDVRLRCATGCPAHEALAALELLHRVEIVPAD